MLFKEDLENFIFALNIVIIKQRSIVNNMKASDNPLMQGMVVHAERKLRSLEDSKASAIKYKDIL